jgi:hypothetical protein
LCSDNSALLDTFFADEEEEVEAEAEGDVEGDEEDSKDKDVAEIQASSNAQEDDTPESKIGNTAEDIEEQAEKTPVQTSVQPEDRKVESALEHVDETKQQEDDEQETEKVSENETCEKLCESSKGDESDEKGVEEKTENKIEDNKMPDSQPEIKNEADTANTKEDIDKVESPAQNEETSNTSNQIEAEGEASKENDQKEEIKEDKVEEQVDELNGQENAQDQQESSLTPEEPIEKKEESKDDEIQKEAESNPSIPPLSEEAPIKANNLKLNQEEKPQENYLLNEDKNSEDHEEKENKPVGDKKSDSQKDKKQELLKDSKTEEKAESEVMENNQEAKQEDGEVANDQEAAEEDKEAYEIDETPIEDALPEEVSDDTKSLEQSADESTHLESDTDPALKKHIIDILFDFLRKDEELNPVLCGYFTKFLYSLMGHNRKGFFTYVFNPDNKVVEYLIKHIYNRSISELLIKILSENLEIEEVKREFIFNLLDSLETQEFEGKINGSMVISELIDTKTFKDIFKSEEVNRRLFQLLRSEDDLTVRSTLIVMNSLYKRFPFYTPKSINEDDQDNFSKLYLPSNAQNTEDMDILPHIDNLLKDELTYIEQIIDIQPRERLEQQYGDTIVPFGATRLQAVKFITNIISLGNTDYAISLAACLPTLLKLCVEYPWNSMLHNYVEMIFSELFKKNSKYKDEIRTAVIAETGLADYISTIQVQSEMPESRRSIRNGVIATFVNIANMLNNHESEYVLEELQKSDKWNEFVCTELFSANENNERALAGHQSKACDSDEESANYETSMDKLFAVFTNLKESHDSSRDLDDSDEDEQVDTANVLHELNSSHERSNDKEDQSEEEPPKIYSSSLLEQVEKEETKAKEENQEKEPEDSENTKIEISERVEEEQLEENNSFYDNSYWQIQNGYDIDELINNDTSF